jgi:hypothetical protein
VTGQASAASGLTRLLSPRGGEQPVISQLRLAAGEASARAVIDGLRAAAGCLDPDTVRVTFGGHFSSGKSSLINMLLGVSLLPVSDDPETGVPCLLRSGTANRILAHTSNGPATVPLNTAAIAGYVSLIGDDGDYRQEVYAVRELDITLATAAIPSGVVWADSPGINDIAAMTELATQVARGGDVLVWVVNSRQPFSLKEQAFLAEHIAERGPVSVVFIVNVFLPADTPAAWSAFLDTRAPSLRRRILGNLDPEMGEPPVVFTSARAAAAHPESFGGPEARALLAAVSHRDAPAVRATRLFRAQAEVRKVADELASRATAAEDQLTRARAASAGQDKVRAGQRDAFRVTLPPAIAAVFARHGDTPARCAGEVAMMAGAGRPQPAAGYAQALAARLGTATQQITGELINAINGCAAMHGQAPLTPAAAQEIGWLLWSSVAPAPSMITGPANAVGNVRPAGQARPGSASAIMENIEHEAGVAIAGLIGAFGDVSGKNRRVIQQQLAQAGAAATAHLLATRPTVVAAAERGCPPGTPPPAAPDDSRLRALRTARAAIVQQVLEPIETQLATCQRGARQASDEGAGRQMSERRGAL